MKKNSELLQVRENVVESILLEPELVEIRNEIFFASLNLNNFISLLLKSLHKSFFVVFSLGFEDLD